MKIFFYPNIPDGQKKLEREQPFFFHFVKIQLVEVVEELIRQAVQPMMKQTDQMKRKLWKFFRFLISIILHTHSKSHIQFTFYWFINVLICWLMMSEDTLAC